MRTELAPSILSLDFAAMAPAVTELVGAGVEWIHLDVMDGQFVPPITFGAKMAEDLIRACGGRYEAHLMTLTPEAHFDDFARAGCERIIFQVEATAHGHRLAQRLRSMGLQAGAAINPGTPVTALEPLLDDLDLALVMTVNPGWGGQDFLPRTLDKVCRLRDLRPDLDIEVDGGIDAATLPAAKAAGANVFVSGSFLLRRDSLTAAVQELRAACA